MIICIDFDETIVDNAGREYSDTTTPLRLMPGAKQALKSLKRAGHMLLVFSARANRALLANPMLDPLARVGKRRVNNEAWKKSQPVNIARYEQMVTFCRQELAGLIDAVDDGAVGKPSCDLFIDDRALRYGHGQLGLLWGDIARIHGEPVYETAED